jgi:predicted ATPase
MLGYPDQALNSLHEALRLAHELAHPFTLAVALYGLAVLHQLRREVQAVHERAEALMALASEQGFPTWVANATLWRGWTLAMRGQAEAGIGKVRQVLTSQLEVSQMAIVQLSILAQQVAEVYGAGGQAGQGLRLLAEALAVVDKTGERSSAAELHRLKGVLLLAQSPDNTAEVEASFHQALAIARRQQARSWELRAAMSLSRLWQQQGKRADARQLLAEIYSRFAEGFDTGNLQDAKALMDALAS